MIGDISYASTAVKNVKQATTTDAYANAVKNISLRQAELALSTKNLTAEKQREILVTAGLVKETGTLTIAQATEALTTDARNAADVEALMLKAGLITELGAETTATITVDAAKLKELVDTKVLTQAEAELLAMKSGVTLQSTKEAATLIASNAKLGSSFALMGKTAGDALKSIGTGLVSFASAHPLIATLVGVVSVVGLVTTGTKKLREGQEQAIETARSLQEEYRSTTKSLSDNISSLESQKDEFERLSKGVDDYGKNISLSSDEYDRYKSIVAEILGYSPELIQGYDAEGNAITNKNSLIERSIELMKEEQRQKLKEMTTDEKTKTAYEGAKADWQQTRGYEGAYTRNEIASFFGDHEKSSGFWVRDDVVDALGLQAEWDKFLSDHPSWGMDNFVIENIEAVTAAIKNNKQALLDLTDAKGKKVFTSEEIENIIGKADTWEQQYADWQQDIENAKHGMDDQFELYAQKADGYNDLTDAQKAFVNEYIKATGDIIDSDGNLLSEDEIIKKAEGYTNFVEELAKNTNFEEARTKINTLFSLDKSKMSASEYEKQVNAILKELQDKFKLTDDEVNDFKIALGFTFTSDGKTQTGELLDQVKGKLKDEFDGKADELTLEELQIAAKIVTDIPEGKLLSWDELQKKIKETQESSNEISTSLDKYKKASDSISALSTAYKELSESEYVSLETISKIKDAVGDSVSNWDSYEQKLLSVKKGTAEYNQLMSELTYTTIEKQLGGVNALAQADEKYVAQLLKENGVLNANEVAHNAVERAKAKEWVQSQANDNITDKTIQNLIAEAKSAGVSTNAYLELTAKEILFNNNKLSTKEKCEEILAIAKTANVASTAYSTLESNITAWASKDLLGSGTRTKTATDLGMTVISEKNRGKEGKGKGNLYVASDGKEFEKYEDAMYYQESLNNVQKISDAYSNTNFVLPDYSGSKTSSSKETKETFNWIETALSRIQHTITNFGKTVSATWKSWTDRNSALKSQISEVTKEIDLQQQAADKYWSLAEGVDLNGTYKELVHKGAMDISTVTNESDIENIKKYQEYYEAYLSAVDAKQDAENELANLVREDFDLISKQFDSEMSLVESNISLIESYIDQAEASGHMVSKNYYSSLIKEGNDNLTLLQSKYDELSEKMSNGVIQEGSEEWYSMSAEVKGVKQAIVEAQTALIEYQNAMDELDWEAFEKMQDRISQITEESDFLINLMSNEKLTNEDGSLTNQGQATLGLHAVNYNTYMAQADEYGKKIKEINDKLAKDPNNQILLDQKQEYIDLQRESILAAEDEKQSMKDVMSESYDSMLSYMDNLINKRKELLQTTKDLHDYEKNVSEQTEEIARLQKILDSLKGDTSEEAKASIQKYTVELNDAREALEETEYDKYISDQEQMLDEMYSVAEEWINQRLDNVDGLIQGVIDETNASAGSIKDTLISATGEVGTTLSTVMNDIWSPSGTLGSVVAGYGNEFSKLTTISETLNSINQSINADQKQLDAKANEQLQQPQSQLQTPPTNTTSSPDTKNTQATTTKTISVGGKINAGSAKIYDYAGDTSGERQYYRNDPIYTVLAEKNGYLKVRHHKLSSGITGWFKKSDVKAYKNGGLVDYTGLAQLDGTPSRPELVLNANDTKNFIALTDTLRNIPINTTRQMRNYQPCFSNNTSPGNFTINGVTLEFPNVKDVNEFITELQHSKRFENIIHEIAFSKNSLSKYKY